jgi:hypothetical protein
LRLDDLDPGVGHRHTTRVDNAAGVCAGADLSKRLCRKNENDENSTHMSLPAKLNAISRKIRNGPKARINSNRGNSVGKRY